MSADVTRLYWNFSEGTYLSLPLPIPHQDAEPPFQEQTLERLNDSNLDSYSKTQRLRLKDPKTQTQRLRLRFMDSENNSWSIHKPGRRTFLMDYPLRMVEMISLGDMPRASLLTISSRRWTLMAIKLCVGQSSIGNSRVSFQSFLRINSLQFNGSSLLAVTNKSENDNNLR